MWNLCWIVLTCCSPREGSLRPRTRTTEPLPEHGKVGLEEERDMQRQIENETWREREGERRRGYDSQRRCLPFLCVTPKPWNEPVHDDCHPYTSLFQLDVLLALTQSNDIWIPCTYLSSNMLTDVERVQTVDKRFCCRCAGSAAPAHPHSKKRQHTPQTHSTKYYFHVMEKV